MSLTDVQVPQELNDKSLVHIPTLAQNGLVRVNQKISFGNREVIVLSKPLGASSSAMLSTAKKASWYSAFAIGGIIGKLFMKKFGSGLLLRTVTPHIYNYTYRSIGGGVFAWMTANAAVGTAAPYVIMAGEACGGLAGVVVVATAPILAKGAYKVAVFAVGKISGKEQEQLIAEVEVFNGKAEFKHMQEIFSEEELEDIIGETFEASLEKTKKKCCLDPDREELDSMAVFSPDTEGLGYQVVDRFPLAEDEIRSQSQGEWEPLDYIPEENEMRIVEDRPIEEQRPSWMSSFINGIAAYFWRN